MRQHSAAHIRLAADENSIKRQANEAARHI